MKKIFTLVFVAISHFSFSQSDEITIPQNTLVPMVLTEEVKEGKNKLGIPAKFVVAEDILVDKVVVIAKNSPVHATVTNAKRGELRVDIYDVTTVDGSVVKLNDCWLFTTFAQNYITHGALFVKGTRKNCVTVNSITIKKSGGKY